MGIRGRTDLANESLVAELRQRHADALDVLLRQHGAEIQAVAYLILRNEHDAEETLADTLLTAWRKIDTLRDPDRLRPWLLTTATRIALRRRRPFRPHVTLARLRGNGAIIARKHPIDQNLLLVQRIESVELMQSPPPGGSGYRVLASLQLGRILEKTPTARLLEIES